ncbi:hypothetical protein BH11PSE2_BH11PSE2_05900 [soil metagenome]
MTDFLRIMVLLGILGAALTVAASAAMWWMEEDRRLRRVIRSVFGETHDAEIIAHGRNAAAAVDIASGQALVMRDGGAHALLYSTAALEGAELIMDNEVVARAFRGEARRPLERVDKEAREVVLRLVFNDPRHPDFDLDLWRPEDAGRRGGGGPAPVIQEARTWLARVDAILRRTGGPSRAPEPVVATAMPPPWDEEDDEDDQAEADLDDDDDEGRLL